jgi:amino acid transporter
MTGFSQSRSFLGGAVSTPASPLPNNFIEVSCRSPVFPRRPSRHNDRSDRAHGLHINTAGYTSSSFLPTPRTFPITPKESSRTNIYERHADDDTSSSTTLFSPTAHLIPLTPRFNPSSEKLGTFSAINIILGKTVGVGIYSIPSSILTSVGSVGASLLLWVIGSLISFCGLAVYLELGTGIPRSGGERVYLERIFKKPRMLATCMFMSYVVLLGFSTPNCIVLGEYVMYAFEIEVNRWNVRSVAVAVITLICLIHARYQKLGLRIINVLGVGKMLILVIVILSGIAGMLMGVGSSNPASSLMKRRLRFDGYGELDHRSTAQRNFTYIFANSSTQPYDYATALLKILYCFRGYSTANQVLSQIRNPIPTLKRAAPIALSLVAIGYILANIAYFLVVEREDFKEAGVVVAGHFFKNIFGEVVGENILPLFIIISAFGNIAATSFAQARVNQELGKDGLLPFSSFFSGRGKREKEDWDSAPPAPGLFLHWLVSVLVILVPPPGEIYNFLVDIGGYPVSVISVAISLGLLYLQSNPMENWESPFKAKRVYTIVFAASNCLLLVLPWIRPEEEKGNGRFPSYAYPATALGILGSGVVYWVWWAKIGPIFGSGDATRKEKGWMRGHKSTLGDGEDVQLLEFNGHQMGGKDEERRLVMCEDEETDIEEEGSKAQGMRKRAPCGCPLKHDEPARDASAG